MIIIIFHLNNRTLLTDDRAENPIPFNLSPPFAPAYCIKCRWAPKKKALRGLFSPHLFPPRPFLPTLFRGYPTESYLPRPQQSGARTSRHNSANTLFTNRGETFPMLQNVYPTTIHIQQNRSELRSQFREPTNLIRTSDDR